MLGSLRLSVTPRPPSSSSFPQTEGDPEGLSGTLKIPPDSEAALVLVGKSPSPLRTPLQALGSPSPGFIH